MRIHCTEDQHSLISFWFFFFQQNSIFYYLFHPTGHGSILNSHFVITQNVITIYFYILIFLINKLWFLLDLNWLRFDMNWNEKYLLRRIYIDVSENFLIIIISLRWNEKKKKFVLSCVLTMQSKSNPLQPIFHARCNLKLRAKSTFRLNSVYDPK